MSVALDPLGTHLYACMMDLYRCLALLLLVSAGPATGAGTGTGEPTGLVPAFANLEFGDNSSIVRYKARENARTGVFDGESSVRLGKDLFEIDFKYESNRLYAVVLWGPEGGEESAQNLCSILSERYGNPTFEYSDRNPCAWNRPHNLGESETALSICSKSVDWRWKARGKAIEHVTCWRKTLGSVLEGFTTDADETAKFRREYEGPPKGTPFSFRISIYDSAVLERWKSERENAQKKNSERLRELFR